MTDPKVEMKRLFKKKDAIEKEILEFVKKQFPSFSATVHVLGRWLFAV